MEVLKHFATNLDIAQNYLWTSSHFHTENHIKAWYSFLCDFERLFSQNIN